MAQDTVRIEGDQLGLVSGVESVRDRVVQRLKFLRGEWFLNQTQGVPYISLFGRGFVDIALLANEVKYEAENVEGVQSALVDVTEIGQRHYRIDLLIESDAGETTISIGLP